jgi:hypothetical protein
MSKMIQVRNVSDKLHRELVRRARANGQTLSDYIEDLLEREVERPPAEEVFETLRRLPPVSLPRPAAEYVREERESRSGG